MTPEQPPLYRDERTLDVPSTAVAIVAGEQQSELWVTTADRIIRYNAKGDEIGSWQATAAAAFDRDNDGKSEALICGPSGLGFAGEPWTSTQPCRAVVVVPGTPALVLSVDTSAHLWGLDVAYQLVDRGPVGVRLDGEPLLVTATNRFAITTRGGSEWTVRTPTLKSTVAAGGPIGGGLWQADSLVWTLPEAGVLTDAAYHDIPVASSPTAVAPFSAINGGKREVRGAVVLHPGAIGQLIGDQERLYPVPVVGDSLAVGDLDGDGCDDVVVGGETQVWIGFAAGCQSRPVVEVAPEVVPLDPVHVTHIGPWEIPGFVGPDLTRTPTRGDRYVGLGGAMLGTLPGSSSILPAFPMVSFETVWGNPGLRAFFGVDSAGFLFWTNNNGAPMFHLLNMSFGAALGGRDLAIGPFATVGLVDAGLGIRAVATPFITPNGNSMGLETRVTLMNGGAGEASAMWVWREGGKRTAKPMKSQPGSFCRSVGILAGATMAASSSDGSWEFIGQNGYAISGSPALGASCEARGLFLSGETAPLESWLYPPERTPVHHLASFSFGPMVGPAAFRVGPIGTAGTWILGAGARVAIRPFVDKRGVRQGLDLRGVALFPYGPGWEFTAMWGVWFDPRRHPDKDL